MGHELENPAVIGDYYEPSKMLPDTDENRMAYVREKHFGWRAAAIGMNVHKFSQEPQKDLMEVIWDSSLGKRSVGTIGIWQRLESAIPMQISM